MNTYIIAYQFADAGTRSEFSRELRAEYPDHHHEKKEGIDFLGVRARKEPGIEGRLKALLDKKYLGDSDFVALIYNQSDDPAKHMRVMVLGHDQYFEKNIGKNGTISTAEYDSLITDMLNAEFQK